VFKSIRLGSFDFFHSFSSVTDHKVFTESTLKYNIVLRHAELELTSVGLPVFCTSPSFCCSLTHWGGVAPIIFVWARALFKTHILRLIRERGGGQSGRLLWPGFHEAFSYLYILKNSVCINSSNL